MNEVLRTAGFLPRLAAFLLDALIVFIPCFAFTATVLLASSLETKRETVLLIEFGLQVFNALIPAAYGALFESSKLQASPGKLLLGLKVVDLQGQRLSFKRALARNLAFVISDLTLGLGYVSLLWNERKQCFHDRVAGCLVLQK